MVDIHPNNFNRDAALTKGARQRLWLSRTAPGTSAAKRKRRPSGSMPSLSSMISIKRGTGNASMASSGPNQGASRDCCSASVNARAEATPLVVLRMRRAASVWAARWSMGATTRIVAVRANSSPQIVASRPDASDNASANTARNAIAPDTNRVSCAVNPDGGTTRSAWRSPFQRAAMAT